VRIYLSSAQRAGQKRVRQVSDVDVISVFRLFAHNFRVRLARIPCKSLPLLLYHTHTHTHTLTTYQHSTHLPRSARANTPALFSCLKLTLNLHHHPCTSKRLWRWVGWLCHKHNQPCCVDSTSASTGSKRTTRHGWCGRFWGTSAPSCTCPRFTFIFCTRSRFASFHGEGATCCVRVAACLGFRV
jgi:hypothetical protein